MPPIAGPAIDANCHADVTQPIAFAKSSLGTTFTTSEEDAGVKNALATVSYTHLTLPTKA